MSDVDVNPIVLTPAAIDQLPWRPLYGLETCRYRLLWRQDNSTAGILEVDPGSAVSSHAHHEAHHHVWVLSGHCEILGERVEAGSYVHIPAGLDHGISSLGPEECVLFYLYLTVT